ncbi:MAG: hypothetical protein E5W60_20010, partial [Mesorhizobium sp.]
LEAIPGKVRSGFPSGIAYGQKLEQRPLQREGRNRRPGLVTAAFRGHTPDMPSARDALSRIE